MNTDSLNKPDPMAEELLKLPVGTNKSLCWDMDVLVAFIESYTTNKIIEELRKVEALEGNPTYAMKWLKDRIKALNHRKER